MPDELRNLWMTEVERIAYEEWNRGMTQAEWAEGWAMLKQPRNYETELGDLILPGIAHCTKKDIFIFNTSSAAHCPIYVVEASLLSGHEARTEVPICLAYDQSHYEMLVPNKEEDEVKTIELKKKIFEGRYNLKMEDIPFLKTTNSCAEAVKRKLEDGPQLSNKLPQRHLLSVVKDKTSQESEGECFLSLEDLKKIKRNDRSKAQTKEYNKLMAQMSRARMTEEKKKVIGNKKKEAMQKSRAEMTEEKKKVLGKKNKEAMQKTRAEMTEEEKKVLCQKNKEALQNSRAEMTEEEKKIMKEKNKQIKEKSRAKMPEEKKKHLV